MTLKVSFILTVLNRPDNLLKFFERMPSQKFEHEWIVVDNGSDAPTKQLEYWLQQYKKVVLIENERNEGFGPGNNQGAGVATGDLLVFTQPDVEFRGDVTNVLQGCIGGVLYGHQLLVHDTGWNRFGSVLVPYLTGYFLACTPETWKTIGGFDAIYWPADFEDVDLSYTAVQKGIALKSIDAPVVHAHFGSTWAQFPDREKVTKRNREKFAAKWNLFA